MRSESTDPVVRICSNQSNVVGDEVAQIYVGYNDSRVERPVKELKGFSKVHLEPGQTKRVDFLLFLTLNCLGLGPGMIIFPIFRMGRSLSAKP